MQNQPCFLSVRDLSCSYHSPEGETKALDRVSFDLYSGEFVAIVGASGCGKSTLLDLIAGLSTLTEGSLTYPMTGSRPSVGYMLQKDHLLDHMTVYGNITLGLKIRRLLTPENIDYVTHLMNQYGIVDFAHAKPAQLSGGMRQRAALIRTLALKPDLLLLDEPTSALDYQTRLMVIQDIREIIRSENITTLLVTHDLSEAISTADRIIVLGKRPGHIKSILELDFGEDHPLTPQEIRVHSRFPYYYNKLWKELCDEENEHR